MKGCLSLRIIPVLIALSLIFYGCINLTVIGIGKSVKPEEAKHYDFSGAIVAVAVDREAYVLAQSLNLMLSDSASFNLYIPEDKNYLLLDVPYSCTGIARTGMLQAPEDPVEWFYNISRFKLVSNKVNYLGRLILERDPTEQPSNDRLKMTNALEKDREWFLEYYPSLSNREWVTVPVRYGTFTPNIIPQD
jgi:hypothetical protein